MSERTYQTFRIVRAPEEPPLTAKDLRYFIRAYRTKSEWEVFELGDVGLALMSELDAANARIKELRGLIRSQEIHLPFDVADDMTTEFAVEIARLEADLEAAKAENAILNRTAELLSRELAEKYYYNPVIKGLDWNNLEEGTKNVVVANIIEQRRAEAEKEQG